MCDLKRSVTVQQDYDLQQNDLEQDYNTLQHIATQNTPRSEIFEV